MQESGDETILFFLCLITNIHFIELLFLLGSEVWGKENYEDTSTHSEGVHATITHPLMNSSGIYIHILKLPF